MPTSKPDATTQHFVMRSIAEAARETAVPEESIRRWIDEGHLPAQRFGRTTLVNVLAVQSLSIRPPPPPGPPGEDWSSLYRRHRPWLRILAATNILAGAASLSVFAGLGPGGLRTAWWFGLCLGSLLVGVAEWLGSAPRRATRR